MMLPILRPSELTVIAGRLNLLWAMEHIDMLLSERSVSSLVMGADRHKLEVSGSMW
jgi:hypothetical protein